MNNIEHRNNRILSLYCEKHTLNEVAAAVGITREGVRCVLKRLGINTKRLKGQLTGPVRGPRFRPQPIFRERFWSQIDQTGGLDACWPWVGKRKPLRSGYVTFTINGRTTYAHHIAFLLANKRSATAWHLHDCGNAMCCNPSHIYDGTPTENAADRVRHGTVVKSSLLSPDQVAIITDILTIPGTSVRSVAQQWGVHYSTVSRAVSREKNARNKSSLALVQDLV